MSFTGDTSGVLRSGSGAESRTPGAASGAAPRLGDTLELGGEATRYEVVRSLGTGGYAEVFLARRLGPTGFSRPVALKCILKGLDVDESTRRAFVYEAQLASKLRHPNIAEAYDLAVVGERYFLVLEYVDGVTLRGALRAAREASRRLSEGFCCHIAASVAEALHHAHTLTDADGKPLGIVHRDVTALNLMVARNGAVKLLDFGVALARIEGRERTRTGQFRGTFVYASPEQALGEPLDGRSDLFSLGVVLVEMLTGIRVFDTETDMGTMRKIAECSPEDIRAATATLSPQLVAICLKALARSPDDRFHDGAQFSHALREYLTARGITYGPSECAAELESLSAFADVHDDEPILKGIEEEASDAASSMSVAPSTSALPHSYAGREFVTPAPGTGPVERGRGASSRRLLAVAVVTVAAAIVATVWVKLPWRFHRGASTPVAEVAAAPIAGAIRAPDTVPVADSRPGPATPAVTTEPDVRSEAEPIVRPKRATGGARVATAERLKSAAQLVQRDRSSPRTTSAEFADRATVGSPRATLPRGTLVPVRLVNALAGPNPSRAEAVVTEEVSAEGVVLVPKGSSVSCSARPAADGRVPLACDTISTSDRVLTFSGVAVGEGHVGLRLLDDEIAAGTPFVVYVNAPAALR